MDKVNLFDLLSFLLPGFLLAEAGYYVLATAGLQLPMVVFKTDLEKGLAWLAAGLLAGVLVHATGMRLTNQRWLAWLVHQPVQQLANQSNTLAGIVPRLHELSMQTIRKPWMEADEKGNMDFFDYCYYYLEAHGKIEAAKTYQALSFCFRNLLLVALLASVAGLLAAGTGWPTHRGAGVLLLSVAGASLLPLVVATRFTRKKMVQRIFWTFYVLRQSV